MIIDMSTGFHFRPESRGFLLAWNDPKETPAIRPISMRASSKKFLRVPRIACPCLKMSRSIRSEPGPAFMK